ncbi:DUF2909 family protein [Marinospirillum alkaliphilum]|uniref:Uncharacterized protein n=1 Tax=Marinospirillum alkaliphilum DSM 21637 TaxID=1122209 RepID=A0A1K1W0C3_9GAMM|nr:DUF2909 family protein [Marinospirillum alkaliphilum]SFX30539.1 Protein of unknown function [Marinospirillum alkaliphilum DSM 21637]
MLKLLIAVIFFAILLSLAAGAGFLIRDQSPSTRLLTSLKTRILLTALLMVLLVYGFSQGALGT